MEANPHQLEHHLRRVFGFDHFRPLQREIMEACLAGRDVCAILPTGGGKSLCFQLPAIMQEGLTLVVSPLIALMKDQVDALERAGVAATLINSSLTGKEIHERFQRVSSGSCRLLYVAPERIMMDGFLSQLKEWNIRLLAIDEAHCISEWGHDFRPDYRQLAKIRNFLPEVPIMALTATATEPVQQDILHQLQLRDPACFRASFDRPNLYYKVTPRSDAIGDIDRYLSRNPGQCGIIYCHSRRTTEKVADELSALGHRAQAYHAGLDTSTRSRVQEDFLKGEIQVVCATIAFGMGINKPDVRFVIHHDLPKNIEGYYQETGRAGRDGAPSECWLLYSRSDEFKYNRLIAEKQDPEERRRAITQLRQMVGYAELTACRRTHLLRYFGEVYSQPRCGSCDQCLGREERMARTAAQFKRANPIALGEEGNRKVLRTPRTIRSTRSKPAALQSSAPLSQDSEALFQRLRQVRSRLAEAQKLPHFMILSNAVLRSMAQIAPRSLEEMEKISGVGPKKIEQFGGEFLKELLK